MKKKLILVITILLVIIGGYFGYKVYKLNYYNINNTYNKTILNGHFITNNITIKTKDLEETDYIEFNGMKIKNTFTNFKKSEQSTDDTLKLYLPSADSSKITGLFIGVWYTYTQMLQNDFNMFNTTKDFKTNNLAHFLKKNNINNDIELLKFLSEKKIKKSNVFTSVKDMDEKYAFYSIMSTIIPEFESITLIDGDYEGYIINLPNDIKEVGILKNDKKYGLTFLNTNYFTDEYIREILSTMIIE